MTTKEQFACYQVEIKRTELQNIRSSTEIVTFDVNTNGGDQWEFIDICRCLQEKKNQLKETSSEEQQEQKCSNDSIL